MTMENVSDFRNGDPLVLELAAVDRRGSVTSNGNVSKMKSLERMSSLMKNLNGFNGMFTLMKVTSLKFVSEMDRLPQSVWYVY